MEFNNRYLLLVVLVFCGLVSESFGHSYVTSPQSRSNQKQTQSGCRGPECLGPCDAPLSSMRNIAGTYARGQQITIQWPRNNHAGGFIRFAWARTTQSDDASAFDTHVQQINCHEVGGCGPSNPSDPNGGDNGAGDGSYKPCQSNITVPGDLTNGGWTLQWAWFGGAFALGDYYSCMDFTIVGGPASVLTPIFVGGDYANPKLPKCKFFNTDRLHVCVKEPCNNPIFTSQQSGMPAFIQKNADGSLIVPIANSVIPAAPVVTPASTSTTSSSSSSTSTSSSSSSTAPATGRVTSSSTGVQSSSSSTSAPEPASSASTSSPASVPSSSTSATPASTSCSIGTMKCVSSEAFSMCAHGSWGVSMSCAPGTTCQPSGDFIICGWPINTKRSEQDIISIGN